MIPSLGASEFGPFATMVVAAIAAIVAGLVVIPWTVARDQPQLQTRGRITVVLLVIGAALATIAALAPYEQRGGRCAAAVPSYGIDVGALATGDSQDRCAVAGQLLVVFAGSIALGETIGLVVWAISRDPVLDAAGGRDPS